MSKGKGEGKDGSEGEERKKKTEEKQTLKSLGFLIWYLASDGR